MLYIITALKSEAQAYVERYRLQRSKEGEYITFRGEGVLVLVSGLGVYKMRLATQFLLDSYDVDESDIFLNIGICGASKNYKIGELVKVATVIYRGRSYTFEEEGEQLQCVESEIDEELYELVDMESYGFYDALIHNRAVKRFYIFKVVSDHFEPKSVTKDATKKLLFNTIDAINKIIDFRR